MPDPVSLSREQLRQRQLREASLRSQRLATRRLGQRRLWFALWQVVLPTLGLVLIAALFAVAIAGQTQTLAWLETVMTALALPK